MIISLIILLIILGLTISLIWYCCFTTSQGVERNRQAIQDLISDIEDLTRHNQ